MPIHKAPHYNRLNCRIRSYMFTFSTFFEPLHGFGYSPIPLPPFFQPQPNFCLILSCKTHSRSLKQNNFDLTLLDSLFFERFLTMILLCLFCTQNSLKFFSLAIPISQLALFYPLRLVTESIHRLNFWESWEIKKMTYFLVFRWFQKHMAANTYQWFFWQ